MKSLTKDRVLAFREILFKENVPDLFKTGTKHLKPIESWQNSGNGDIIVSTKKIISFFFASAGEMESLNSAAYLNALDLLFDLLSKNSQGYTFESDAQIPETDIQKADDTLAVKYLTNNLIITYFNCFRLGEGQIDRDLRKNDFAKLITVSNEGRDYRTLVGNTLKRLIKTLQSENSWARCIKNIHQASLVCKLVGARLPQIDKSVLQTIITSARKEIRDNLSMLTKVMSSKDQLLNTEKDQKKFIQKMEKLNTACEKTMQLFNRHLKHIYSFMEATGIPVHSFLGRLYEPLKESIVILIFNHVPDLDRPDPELPIRNLTALQFRMNQLFKMPEIIRFMKHFRHEKKHMPVFSRLLGIYFEALRDTMEQIIKDQDQTVRKDLEIQLNDVQQLLSHFDYESEDLTSRKEKIHQLYLHLIENCPADLLPDYLKPRQIVSDILQDTKRQLYEDIRKTLIKTCCTNIMRIENNQDSTAAMRQAQVKTIMSNYYLNYQPRRFFYPVFMKQYIGFPGSPVSSRLTDLMQMNTPAALSMLEHLSKIKADPSGLLSSDQIAYCRKLFDQYAAI